MDKREFCGVVAQELYKMQGAIGLIWILQIATISVLVILLFLWGKQ